MRTPSSGRRLHQRPDGFTLVELLVVISIIVLITAASLPVVLPALGQRKVSEGARILHAALAGARDEAIRAGEPRGIRLIPDPSLTNFSTNINDRRHLNPLAVSRIVSISPAPDYSEGRVVLLNGPMGGPNGPIVTFVAEVRAVRDPNSGAVLQRFSPTSWYWNIRQGDRIRFEESGSEFTIAGPIQTVGFSNPDRYINMDTPGSSSRYISLPFDVNPPAGYVSVNPLTAAPWVLPSWILDQSGAFRLELGEVLFLVNGQDDDRDGWIDEAFDGIDNDRDGFTDPGFNGVDENKVGGVDDPAEWLLNNGGEYEPESLPTRLTGGLTSPSGYVIHRRPVVSERAQEVSLPPDVVIDLTSFNAVNRTGQILRPERSRLPIDPYTGVVDILISPTGAVIPTSPGQQAHAGASTYSSLPFYHFWITEREDVVEWSNLPPAPTTQNFVLPMPRGTRGYGSGGRVLEKDRRLVTLFSRTGQVSTTSIEGFEIRDTDLASSLPEQIVKQAEIANRPFLEAQFGIREEP